MSEVDEVRSRVEQVFPELMHALESLLRIPSVNAEEDHRADTVQAAAFVAELFANLGLEVDIVRAPRPDGTVGAPAVIAKTTPVSQWPTVLLYAHHDVQPVTGQEGWDGDPFSPVVLSREEAEEIGLSAGDRGRIVARGSADDKGGVIAHLGAIMSLGDERRVNVIVLIEGEEEIGSPSMPALLQRYGDLLDANVALIIDGNMWAIDTPMMTASMRGLLVGDVTVEAFSSGLHSGGYGGPVLDANVLAARLIASMHDRDGRVAVRGLSTGEPVVSRGIQLSQESFRRDATLLEETKTVLEAVGNKSSAGTEDRPNVSDKLTLEQLLWTQPSIAVIGIDSSGTSAATGVLAPSCTFRVSLRLPPGLAPAQAEQSLREHLEQNRPFGARVGFHRRQSAQGFTLDLESVAAVKLQKSLDRSWGSNSVAAGVGGTVPLLHMLSERFPGMPILKVGTGDPDSKPHGQNESASLDVLFNLIVALDLFLRELPKGSGDTLV